MSFLNSSMKQTATWWDLSSYNEFGDPSFAAPELLTPADGNGVRWENRSDKIPMKTGDQDQGHAVVYSAVTEFAVGDYLYLGTSSATDPETVSGADRVIHAEKIPDVQNRVTLYKAVL